MIAGRWPSVLAGLIICFCLLLLPPPEGMSESAWLVVALTALMAIWWVTEAIPIPVTGLLPLVFLPLSGVMPIAEAAVPYANRIILLLMGGFIIAKSVERWGLHKRIALNVVSRAGTRSKALLGGFMLASALLSMWISNTATTIMLTPIAISVGLALGQEGKPPAKFIISLLLAVAYGASIGGLGTPVGSPTNLIIIGYLETEANISISFGQWMLLGLPVVLVLLPAAWAILSFASGSDEQMSRGAGQSLINEEIKALGRMSSPEKRTLLVFLIVAFFWVFRKPLQAIDFPGGIAPFAGLTDHVTAIAGAILLFLVPSGSRKQPGTALLDWDTARDIPWGVLLLFGGGLSLAAAISGTGLAAWLGNELQFVAALPVLLILLSVTTFVIFATEMTSNVATASTLLPVIGAMAVAGGLDPMLLAAPVAMAASCAFMLPIATGPNAVVFASGHIPLKRMAMIGLWLNLAAIVLITLVVRVVAPLVFA